MHEIWWDATQEASIKQGELGFWTMLKICIYRQSAFNLVPKSTV